MTVFALSSDITDKKWRDESRCRPTLSLFLTSLTGLLVNGSWPVQHRTCPAPLCVMMSQSRCQNGQAALPHFTVWTKRQWGDWTLVSASRCSLISIIAWTLIAYLYTLWVCLLSYRLCCRCQHFSWALLLLWNRGHLSSTDQDKRKQHIFTFKWPGSLQQRFFLWP